MISLRDDPEGSRLFKKMDRPVDVLERSRKIQEKLYDLIVKDVQDVQNSFKN